MSKHSNKKNSLVIGGLTSSAGLFLTKAIGILYVAPFRAIIGPDDYVYYAAGYELYNLVLTISLAGLPFAIAAIVSKYMEKEDYRTVMLVKKISQGLLAAFGLISSLAIILFINQFVNTRGTITSDEALIYRNVYYIMTISIFTVPILSSYRGFFQGIKNYTAYSFSQVLEQIVRIVFLLGVGALLVYGFKLDRITAVYMALIASAVAAIATIVYFAIFNRDAILSIDERSKLQDSPPRNTKSIIKELFVFAIPYLLSVILSSRVSFANMAFLPSALQAYGYDSTISQLYTSMITNEALKLVGIPVVLATGFAVAVIPEMSQALVRNDQKTIQKNVSLSIESVLLISLPLYILIYFLANEIYFILFGGSEMIINMGGAITKGQVIVSIISILSPILVPISMTLNLARESIMGLIVAFIFNLIILTPLVTYLGYVGSFIAELLPTVLYLIVIFYYLSKKRNIKFKYTVRRIVLMFVAIIPMAMVYYLLHLIGLPVISLGRFKGLFTLAIYGITMLTAYLITAHYFLLPQSILNINLETMAKKVFNRAHR